MVKKLDMVDFRRSLFSSVTREDDFSSPLFTIRSAQCSRLQSVLYVLLTERPS